MCNLGQHPPVSSIYLTGVIVVRANKEMLDIMKCHASVCTDVEASNFINSVLVGAEESIISGS